MTHTLNRQKSLKSSSKWGSFTPELIKKQTAMVDLCQDGIVDSESEIAHRMPILRRSTMLHPEIEDPEASQASFFSDSAI